MELVTNGNFSEGLKGWTTQGGVSLQGSNVVIMHDGEISQTIERQDLSFFLELSYEVRAILYNPTASASSLITYYVADPVGRTDEIQIVTHAQKETQGSFGLVKVNLLSLFRQNVGVAESLRLTKVKITLKLTFQGLPFGVSPSIVYFRNVSLKRMNPVKLVLEQSYKELRDQTELSVSITNVGDLDASNIVASLDLSSELSIASEKKVFQRSVLEGGSSWQVAWTLTSRSSGTYSVTVKVGSDQTEVRLPVRIPIQKPQQAVTTQAVATTSLKSDQTQTYSGSILVAAAIAGVAMVIVIVFLRRRVGVTSLTKASVGEEAKPKVESPRKPREEKSKSRDYQRYLKRLEELKSQGKIGEKVYERLRKEYEVQTEEDRELVEAGFESVTRD